ncbi:MAG TPA: amidohydrolase family protein [Dehalococcoidales bacterium]|nr:amidohydrolase family protein [Dehalococcoidales bacterium]
MKSPYSLKIDAYAHIVPPKYGEALHKVAPEMYERQVLPCPPLYDLDERFRIMDKYEPLRQVLTLGRIPVEHVAGPAKAAELAERADDEMAELVNKYRDRFCGALATLTMNNMDAALKETDRAIKDLKFKGVYLHTPVDEKPLDAPEFLPLYEKMSEYDLPIVIHPMRRVNHPDYLTEKESRYNMFSLFGWPYDTTSAMARLVFSGIMEKYPNLKIVTHHLGGMVPFYAERIRQFTQLFSLNSELGEGLFLKKEIVDYFKMFYADTAIYGNPAALMCGHDFFGPDHVLFGIDFPLGDIEHGDRNYRQTINAIEQMDITEEDKKKIYEDNARKLMRLPI